MACSRLLLSTRVGLDTDRPTESISPCDEGRRRGALSFETGWGLERVPVRILLSDGTDANTPLFRQNLICDPVVARLQT
jgi:hypothetical protein